MSAGQAGRGGQGAGGAPRHRPAWRRALGWGWGLASLVAGAAPDSAAPGAGYSTLDRVVYVQACMDDHPGPRYEMQSKCSCVFDALAGALSPEEFDELSTLSKAVSIGGERGGVLRDNPQAQTQARRYRELQVQARQRCFVSRPPSRP